MTEGAGGRDLWAPRWGGRPGRLEVWYATLTDATTGTGVWIHHERVAPVGAPSRTHGWAVVFPPDGAPVPARFDGARPLGVPGRIEGAAGRLGWSLAVSDDSPPLHPFPAWAWRHEVLPAVQIVPAPAARFVGAVIVDGRELPIAGRGSVARIYGRGNALRWAWLHADLGGSEALEVVAAVSALPGLRALPPLVFARLRTRGRDWPRTSLPATATSRARIALPEWSARLVAGTRRLTVDVRLDLDRSVSLEYADPHGRRPVCTNSEVASADLVLEQWRGRWHVERRWSLDGTAHAEVGLPYAEAPLPAVPL